jgi:hypothetical protein
VAGSETSAACGHGRCADIGSGKVAGFPELVLRCELMSKRDAQQITVALMALTDARDALAANRRDAALRAVEAAADLLEEVEHAPGVPVARAAALLGVSDKTVLVWIERGALTAVPNAKPRQVDRASLRLAVRALEELRRRGQDRDWLQALVDDLDDRRARRGDALREGLEQVRKGELEPA